MKKRVVITGLGMITPLGNDVRTTWDGIRSGRSGIGPVTLFDTSDFPARVGGEIKNFDPTMYIDRREARKMARFTQYSVAATAQALQQAGIKPGDIDPERTGVVIGNGIGGFEIIEEAYYQLIERGPGRVPPMTIPKMITNECPGNISITFGFHGPSFIVTTACASGTDAIGNALNLIRGDICDTVVSGGTEGCITKMGLAGFCVLKALSTNFNDRPQEASRPFDRDRDGFVMGEGAGIIILESLEHAQKRGAHILAELAGYGQTCDAFHLTAPDSEGIGSSRAMIRAIEDAGIRPEDVDYINAHGTSTPTNDPIETVAIKKAFGEHAYRLKISSTKSMTGHLVGGAGGIEAIFSVLAINEGFYPPTINFENADPACDLDYVPNKGVEGTIKTVMSDSLGFGGHNGVLIIRKYEA